MAEREREEDKRGIARKFADALFPDRARDEDDEVVYAPDPLDERDVTPPNAEPHKVHKLPGAETIKKHTVEALVFRAISTPLAFGLTILQSRALGTEGTGEYALTTLTVLLFSRLLSDLGNAATRQMGDDNDEIGRITALAIRLCVIFVPIGVGGIIVLTQFPGLIGEKKSVEFQLALLAAVALGPNIVRQTMSGILVGLGQIRLWSYLQVLPSVLAFVFFFVFVGVDEGGVQIGIFDLGVEGAILGWALGHLITATIALVATRRIWWPHLLARIPAGTTLGLVRMALAMGLVSVILLLNYRIEFLLIDRFSDTPKEGKDAVGAYKVATQIAEALWLITTAIATATWTTVLHEREDRAAGMVLRSCAKGLLFLGVGAGVIVVLVPTLVPLIFKESFEPAVTAVMWLLPGVIAYGPVALLSPYISVRHRRPRLALVGPIASIIVTVTLAIPLIQRYGIDGAAAASSAGYIVSAVITWIMFVRVAGLNWRGRVAPSPA